MLRIMLCHSLSTSAGTATRQAQARESQRPMLDPEEYDDYTFKQFKDRLGYDQDDPSLLRECLGSDIFQPFLLPSSPRQPWQG